MHLSGEITYKTCADPQAHYQKLSQANLYENDMVSTYCDVNCSGASPISGKKKAHKLLTHELFETAVNPARLTRRKCLFPGLVHDFPEISCDSVCDFSSGRS